MRRVNLLVFVFAMPGLSAVSAQPPGMPPGGPPFQRGMLGMGVDPLPIPPLVLINMAAVRTELKLTEEQAGRIEAVFEGLRAQRQLSRQATQNRVRPPAEANDYVAVLGAQTAGAEAAMFEILDARQRARLDQIRLRALGPLAFREAEVRARLELDPAQSAKVAEIVDRGYVTMWESSAIPLGVKPGEGPLTPERRRALLASDEFRAEAEKCRVATLQARDATLKAVAMVLTDSQNVIYRKMLGDPFDVSKLRDPTTGSKQEPKARGDR